jgi:hypothetical protein
MRGADVFISYRREYASDAGRLSDWLRPHFGPDRVFMDVTGISPGKDFPAVTSEAIRDCKAVVAVLTPRWGADLGDTGDWVRRELREALAAGRPIVPVLLHGAAPPQRSELPPELAELADKEAVVVSDADFRDDIGRLIETLEDFGAEPAALEAFPEIPKSARAEARAAWDAADDPEHARERLAHALAAHGIRVSVEHGDDLLLEGGSKSKYRLLGGLGGTESRMPLRGRLRIRDRGAAVAIEVLLEEDWGFGVFWLGGRYSSHFDKVLADLRRATARR